jgi:membrane-bound ClpP family serine protease
MSNTSFPFSKKNYRLMLIGMALIVLGFILIGLDGEPHGNGVLGLTIGPIVTLAGFIFEFYAIFAKSGKN